MINFLIGRACTGKTQRIIDKVCASSLSKRAILIVPEQFTFESEREIIKRAGADTTNITVISFTRLFGEVLSSASLGSLPIVSEFEKIIILKKALKACSDNLSVFSRHIHYRDFPLNIADTLKDFKFAGTTPEALECAAEKIGGSCGAKLKDISLIWSTYDSLLTDKFIDSSDILTKTYELLCDNSYFKGCDVYFDSFTGFTGQQYKIIEKIFEQADNVTFAFSTDNPDDTNLTVFHNINNTITALKDKAKRNGISLDVLAENHYNSKEIAHLEGIMSGKVKGAVMPSNNKVNVISCENLREEALAAANIVSKCVREEGYRFKDFILVSRNADSYYEFVERQCKNNDVAYFCDKKTSVRNTLLCTYIMALLDICKSCTSDNIFKIVKMGLYDIDVYDIAELENYVFVWDIKGKDWFSPWEMKVKGLTNDEEEDYDVAKLKRINETREKIVAIINDFKDSFTGSAKKRATALYNHLTKYAINKKLSAICEFYENGNDAFRAAEVKQSWDVIVNILDSVVRTSDDSDISIDEFTETFSIACDFATITNVPQMLDEVTFGSADRIRPSKPKVAIILGANQGVFPQTVGNGGLFGFSEKQKIKDQGIDLDDNIIKSTIEENYLVYSMLCCPTDKVYLLYSRNNMNGEKLETSSFVSQVVGAFDKFDAVTFKLKAGGDFTPRTPKSAFSEIGTIVGEDFELVKETLASYPIYNDKLPNAISDIDYSFKIDNTSIKGCFGDEIKIYPTNFEEFHRCKASYFFRNVLRLKKIQKSDLNTLQRGTIAHFVFENVIKTYGSKLADLSESEINDLVDELIHQYFLSIKGYEILVSERFAYLIEKIAAAVKRIVCHMKDEFAQCDFEPKYCELVIGDDGLIPKVQYILSDNSIASLNGKIDRVDIYNNNVRVVDYKTGSLHFSLSDTLFGLNMQMLIYLYAFVKNGDALVKNPQAAAILYRNSSYNNDPKTLKMNGLISKDAEIREAMEKGNKGKFIPVLDGRNKTTYVDSSVFKLIFDKIDSFTVDMGEDILKGDFTPNPVDTANSEACKYCNFASICRASSSKHKTVEKHTNDEVIDILNGGGTSGIQSN